MVLFGEEGPRVFSGGGGNLSHLGGQSANVINFMAQDSSATCGHFSAENHSMPQSKNSRTCHLSTFYQIPGLFHGFEKF